eukprot:6203815-Pleurochrysis_carterae.AAC.1
MRTPSCKYVKAALGQSASSRQFGPKGFYLNEKRPGCAYGSEKMSVPPESAATERSACTCDELRDTDDRALRAHARATNFWCRRPNLAVRRNLAERSLHYTTTILRARRLHVMVAKFRGRTRSWTAKPERHNPSIDSHICKMYL